MAAARLLLVAALLAAAYACVPAFVCSDDAQCDEKGGGRCKLGHCEYGGGGETGATGGTGEPGTSAASDVVTGGGTTSGETDDTDAPASCVPFDVVLTDTGKATGVAVDPDGSLYVVGVTRSPLALRLVHLHANGEPDWSVQVAANAGASADDDTDVWARVFLRGAELTVVHSQRFGEPPFEQDGIHISRFAAADGALLGTSEALVTANRSLRAAAAPDGDTLLVAGETKENLWYQRVARSGETWAPTWANPMSFVTMTDFHTPAIAQAIAALPGGAAVVGGSWDHDEVEDVFRGWVRRVADDGAVACECTRDGAGVLAIAGADAGFYVGGFRQTTEAELWLAHVPDDCPESCAATWEISEPGQTAYTEFFRAEFVQDAIYTLVPLADGVLAGGVSDKQPFLARYDGNGVEQGRMAASAAVDKAAVLALAVEGACVTLVGSTDYANYGDRLWWARRIAMP